MSPLRAGIIAVIIIVVASFFAFTKDIPFTRTYQVQAVVKDTNLVAPRSPVRIAGIDVGKVVEVEPYKGNMSVVTMEIQDAGRPIRKDATLKIRPRLFLEGNNYIDMQPGTPTAEELPDGGMIPVSQTASPVQLDNVLTALQSDTRTSLQKTLVGLGDALNSKPTPEDDLDQDPDVQGLTAGQAVNKAIQTGPGALRGGAISAEALRGTEPRDLSKLIRGLTGVSRGLARNEGQLGQLLTDLNTTLAATASRAPELREAVKLLGPTTVNLRKGLASVDEALPPTQAFAREILPGLRETPATVAASMPWLEQVTPFVGPRELGGLLDDLAPTTVNLASATHSSREWLPKSDAFNRCINEVIIPTGNIEVQDGDHSANTENYKEFWHAMVGQAGEGQGFDGNGSFLRLASPGGAKVLRSGKTNLQRESLLGAYNDQPQRTSPAFPATLPPLQRKVPCYKNGVPDVNGSSSIGGADGSAPDAAAPNFPPSLPGAVTDESSFASSAQLLPLSTFGEEASQ